MLIHGTRPLYTRGVALSFHRLAISCQESQVWIPLLTRPKIGGILLGSFPGGLTPALVRP